MNTIDAFAMKWHLKRLTEALTALEALPIPREHEVIRAMARIEIVRDQLLAAAIAPVAVEADMADERETAS